MFYGQLNYRFLTDGVKVVQTNSDGLKEVGI